jgi:hypothetical protein
MNGGTADFVDARPVDDETRSARFRRVGPYKAVFTRRLESVRICGTATTGRQPPSCAAGHVRLAAPDLAVLGRPLRARCYPPIIGGANRLLGPSIGR